MIIILSYHLISLPTFLSQHNNQLCDYMSTLRGEVFRQQYMCVHCHQYLGGIYGVELNLVPWRHACAVWTQTDIWYKINRERGGERERGREGGEEGEREEGERRWEDRGREEENEGKREGRRDRWGKRERDDIYSLCICLWLSKLVLYRSRMEG